MSETISPMLLQQRIRNRMIDVLEIASSFEGIAKFGAFEVINLWEDWYRGPDPAFYPDPVFSAPERPQLDAFSRAWDEAAAVREDDIFDAEKLRDRIHWRHFKDAAESALRVFERRGRLPEDEEQFQL